LEASKAEAFAGKTKSKSTGKSRKEAFFAQMPLLQNREFIPSIFLKQSKIKWYNADIV
jgi:hypothetical protein